MRKFLICLLFIVSVIYAEDIPFIPTTIMKGPIKPEASDYRGIQSKFGTVDNRTCMLNISETEVGIPGNGLLSINISRAYGKHYLDIEKSDAIISNYVESLYTNPSWQDNVELALLLGVSTVNGQTEYLNRWLNDPEFRGNWDKMKPAIIRNIHQDFDMYTANDFYNAVQKPFGEDWFLLVNGFSSIFVWEMFDTVRDPNAPNTQKEKVRYYWHYKAQVLSPNGSIVFERDYKDNQAHPLRFDSNSYNSIKTDQNKNGYWKIAGFKANGINESDVVTREDKKFKYNDATGNYELIMSGGVKYIFGNKQTVVAEKAYTNTALSSDYITQKRVEKYIVNLIRIEDKYGNYIAVNYSGNKIASVTDKRWINAGAGKVVQLNYTGNLLSSIQYPNDAGGVNSLTYGYTAGRLTSAVNAIGQTTSYDYFPSDATYAGELKRIVTPNGLEAQYAYASETFWYSGYTEQSPPPIDAVRSMFEPNPQKIVAQRTMYQDSNPIGVNTKSYFKATYFLWASSKPNPSANDVKDNFLLDAVVVSETENSKVNTFTYNKRGLLVSVHNEGTGMFQALRYEAGSPVKYYTEPTEVKQAYIIYGTPAVTNYLSKTSNVYDASGFLSTSFAYVNESDANCNTKSAYTMEQSTIGDFFFTLPKQMDVYDSANVKYKSVKADYNTLKDIETNSRFDSSSGLWKQMQRAVYDATYPWQVIKTYGPLNDEPTAISYQYDSVYHAFVTSVANSLYSTGYEYYTESGRIKKLTDENNNQIEFTYDAVGRLLESKELSTSLRTVLSYDDAKRAVTTTRKYNNETLIESVVTNDYHGKPVFESKKDFKTGIVTANATKYWPSGVLYQSIQNAHAPINEQIVVSYDQYDGLDRPLYISYANGLVETFSYSFDFVNKWSIITKDNNRGQRNIDRKDFMGRLIESVKTGGGSGDKQYITRNTYNARNEITAVTFQPQLPNPIVFGKTYDQFGRLLTETLPGNVMNSYTYYDDDQVATIQTPRGTETRTYEPKMRRISKVDYQNDPDINYYYDDVANGNKGLGKLTKKEKAGVCSNSFYYDSFGRIKKETKSFAGFTYMAENNYNTYGELASVVLPGGTTVTYDNDHSGNTLSVTYGAKKIADYYYNNKYQLDYSLFNNGALKTEYQYLFGVMNNIKSSVVNPADNLLYFDYAFDKGILNKTTDIDGREVSYYYDTVTEALTNAKYSDNRSLEYVYDDFFNRTSDKTEFGTHQYSFDYSAANNRLLGYTLNGNANTKVEYSYDNVGNTSSEVQRNAQRTQRQRTYTWSDGGQITSILDNVYPENAKKPSASLNYGYEYDENNIRFKKNVNGRIKYEISLGGFIFVLNDTGTVTKTYLSGVGHADASGNVFYYFRDRLGSVYRVVNEANAVMQVNSFDPYGNIIYSKSKIEQEKIYTGKALDDESAFYYYGARFYNPLIGRWLSGDPKRQDHNLYMFNKNNPAMYIDPNGEYSFGFNFLSLMNFRPGVNTYDLYEYDTQEWAKNVVDNMSLSLGYASLASVGAIVSSQPLAYGAAYYGVPALVSGISSAWSVVGPALGSAWSLSSSALGAAYLKAGAASTMIGWKGAQLLDKLDDMVYSGPLTRLFSSTSTSIIRSGIGWDSANASIGMRNIYATQFYNNVSTTYFPNIFKSTSLINRFSYEWYGNGIIGSADGAIRSFLLPELPNYNLSEYPGTGIRILVDKLTR